MKEERGSVATKIIIISIILLTVLGTTLIILFKTGNFNLKMGKSNESDKNYTDSMTLKMGKSNESNKNYTDSMTYITKEGDNYIFIDTGGNVRKISTDVLGEKIISNDRVFYKNSMLASKDGEDYIINFDGDTLYGPADIEELVSTEDSVLYQIYEDGKYGVVDGSGNVIISPEYEESMTKFTSDLSSKYFYTYDYNENSTGNLYVVTIFDCTGKKAYESDFEDDNFFGEQVVETNNGINVILLEKNEGNKILVNLNTGDVIKTLNLVGDYTIDVSNIGNIIEVEWYEGSRYGSRDGRQRLYYWFGENEKVSKEIQLDDNEDLWFDVDRDKDLTILNTDSDNIVVNEYGKEIYSSTNPISCYEYVNTKSGLTYAYIVETLDKNKYKTMNSEVKTILEQNLSSVGNNYILSNKTLYKHDGTKYLEDVTQYNSLYDLDIITTKDKTIIENSEGKKVEEELDFKLVNTNYLLDDNTVVLESDKYLTIIDMKELSIKTIDISSYDYVYANTNGYLKMRTDSEYEYYNKNGELIYSEQK